MDRNTLALCSLQSHCSILHQHIIHVSTDSHLLHWRVIQFYFELYIWFYFMVSVWLLYKRVAAIRTVWKSSQHQHITHTHIHTHYPCLFARNYIPAVGVQYVYVAKQIPCLINGAGKFIRHAALYMQKNAWIRWDYIL